jgi:hypothetical protein
MSSPPDTPLAPTRWAAMFEKQAESTVGDYDMRASAAYIRSPVGSPQLRGLQRRELAVPLLGATKAPVAAPRIIERGTAHAAMIFHDLLRKEQYELKLATSASSSSFSLGGASPRSQSPQSLRCRTSSQPENRLRFRMRMQRAKAPEHPILCAPCGKACAKDELPSAHSSCASVPDAGGPAVIAAAAPAPTHESPVAIESALDPLAGPPAPLPLWDDVLRRADERPIPASPDERPIPARRGGVWLAAR